MIIKGQMINDRYSIIRTIGEGGMANVYLAYDTILDRNVAVKILRGDLADDEKFVRRFQREAISASSLAHPNIVEMYDVGEDDGKYFIVMEFIDGKTLKNLIKRRGALTLPEVIDIMMQLTSAIACAHDSYIIHRDIKPQNVMILEDGRVKITDFGIAMALNNNELTQTNSVMGSVHYLPPEQASGSGSTIKCDIYSLGILMYELLTGKVPFRGDTAVEIAIKQMKESIPSVRKYNPTIPQSVENIVLKACAKNPKNRYDNVALMHEDIRTCLDENRKDEARYVYPYPEQDLEETKVIPKIQDIPSESLDGQHEVESREEKEKKKEKKLNIALLVTGAILFVTVAAVLVYLFLIPKSTVEEDVSIPDVSNMSVVDAENMLLERGLHVAIETEKVSSSTILEGRVIGTKPDIGRKVKKATEIVLIVSSGNEKVEIERYIGQNVQIVEDMLKNKGIEVQIQKINVEDKANAKADIIIEQSIKEGSKVDKNTQMILYVADIVTTYPNFTDGSWTIDDIQVFCDEYGLTLIRLEKETSEQKPGTILNQSYSEGTKIWTNATLRITIAKAPVVIPDSQTPTGTEPSTPDEGEDKENESNEG